MEDRIRTIIETAIEAQELLLAATVDRARGDDAPLFGGGGPLDSMALVSLVVAIEEAVQRELRCSVTLVSEKAMSARRSPFATVGSLRAFVQSSIAEASNV